ncbi:MULTISPECIES: hypothetical protein [unclassified Bradyrhizobium]|uniref:hypothetical protein n=1 Tax=unclassified Bradyrhizobium TaxID=2631580 RepID=UPI00244D06C1|nr:MULTISPECIES: hypothetical protein [unclassified Bradyrhizobium]MDH2346993.1 hypothetical protein [Bradyrhizobium sp. SSUT77]MDH2355361.1 hypothetical protein [Bradyrhizobium sp. SSUT112]
MRKLILIATMSLLATQAYAGGPRSLSLAATNAGQQTTEQPAAPATGTPQAVQTPAATQPTNVQTATTTPTSTGATAPTTVTAPAVTTPTQSSAAPVTSTAETVRPKRRQPSTEARVIRELHRHGIYW